MKTAVIYARFSCDKQTEQSIEGQIRVCNEFAAKNDIKVVDTYIDRAASGTNDNRVAFQKMLTDSEKNPMWDIVLVYAIDRFGRNSIDIAVNKQRLQKNNIILISATQKTSVNIDGSKNLDGIILENVLIGISEYYSVELSQKIRRGQRESRKKGNFLGGHIPYGYRVENKKLLIDDEKAEVLRLIFNLYVSGRYVREILEELNNRGILYNGKPMYKSTLFKLLKNEKYTGVYRYDGEIYDNIYPQIIPTHIFERVQKMMKKNKIGASSRNTDFILKDKVYCGLCGMSITGDSGTSHNGTKNFYYSHACLNEMGAAWILDKNIYPILLGDLNPNDMKGFIDSHYIALMPKEGEEYKLLSKLNKYITKRNTEKTLQDMSADFILEAKKISEYSKPYVDFELPAMSDLEEMIVGKKFTDGEILILEYFRQHQNNLLVDYADSPFRKYIEEYVEIDYIAALGLLEADGYIQISTLESTLNHKEQEDNN